MIQPSCLDRCYSGDVGFVDGRADVIDQLQYPSSVLAQAAACT